MRVLVADDHTLYRQGLRQALADAAGGLVMVEAASFDAALARAADSGPFDVALVCLALPGLDPAGGLATLCRRLGETPVVAIATSEDPADVGRVVARGARGYILKSARAEVLYHAVLLVLAGEIYVPPIVLARRRALAGNGDYGPLGKLTPREREVLERLVDGLTNKEIAQALAIGEGTVKVHLKAVLRKLEVANRTQAATLAMRLGWPAAGGGAA